MGMPAALHLQMFGDLLFRAFGAMPYQVGSSLTGTVWRDVDVRIMLDPETYQAYGFGDPKCPHENERWVAMTMAFSALGRQMTGLPVDFQFQDRDLANSQYGEPRSALVMGILRRQNAADKTA